MKSRSLSLGVNNNILIIVLGESDRDIQSGCRWNILFKFLPAEKEDGTGRENLVFNEVFNSHHQKQSLAESILTSYYKKWVTPIALSLVLLSDLNYSSILIHKWISFSTQQNKINRYSHPWIFSN